MYSMTVFLVRFYGTPNGAGRCPMSNLGHFGATVKQHEPILLVQYCMLYKGINNATKLNMLEQLKIHWANRDLTRANLEQAKNLVKNSAQ